MKKLLTVLAFLSLFLIQQTNAQYSVIADLSNPNNTGGFPYGGLITYSTYLYGMTSQGGAYGYGLVFKVKVSDGTFTKLLDFDGQNGKNPRGSLFLYGGELYGMTEKGGENDSGVVFKIDTSGQSYTKIYDLGSLVGGYPYGSPYIYNNTLYAMTKYGGQTDSGVIFRINLNNGNFSVIHNFDKPGGGHPEGSLVSDGEYLYGMTYDGGDYNNGVLFKLNISNLTYTKLFVFNNVSGLNGSYPHGSPILVGDTLYGFTSHGGINSGGTFFKYDLSSNTMHYLYNFDINSSLGSKPMGSPASDGTYIYGSTSAGGSYGYGTIFRYSINGGSIFVLENLNPNKGENVYGKLCPLVDYIYGLAYSGGKYYSGAMFKILIYASNSLHKIIDFDGFAFGETPGRFFTSDDKFIYGYTKYGGIGNKGIVFKINKLTHKFTKILDIDKVSGNFSPGGGLYLDNGVLYVLSASGGSNNHGMIIKIYLADNSYSVQHEFSGSDGSYPLGYLIPTADYFYGITNYGGSNNHGLVFKIYKSPWFVSTLHEFDGTTGSNPRNAPIIYNNALYGTTQTGGSHSYGVIYKIDLTTGTYETIFNFNGTNGNGPECRLLPINGYLYGTTGSGGVNDQGVVFKIAPDGSNYTILHEFSYFDGAHPLGSLTTDSSYIYGITNDGGENDFGVLYKISLDSNTFTKLMDMDQSQGSSSSDLLIDGNYLYGTTQSGGPYDLGTIFSYQLFYPEIDIQTNQGTITNSNTYDFSEVPIDTFKTTSFTIQNLSQQAELNLFGNPAVQLAQGTAFSLFQAPNQTLAPGYTTTFQIKFSPTEEKQYHDTITIESDDPDDNPFIIYLTGTGTSTTLVTAAPNMQVKIYPNPAKDYVLLTFSQKPVAITITDIAGHTLYTTSQTKSHMKISLSQFPASILLVSIVTPDYTVTKKIIKQ